MKNQTFYQKKCRKIHNLRNLIYKALKSIIKSSSSKDLFGIEIDFCKHWIEYQMISEMKWNNNHINQVKPVVSFDVSKEEKLIETRKWKKSANKNKR